MPNRPPPAGGPRRVRVLVANEPRAYRETLVAAVQRLRPHLEVIMVEPAALDAAVRELAPSVVVCSQFTPQVEVAVLAWVVLYPEGHHAAVLGIARAGADDRGRPRAGRRAEPDRPGPPPSANGLGQRVAFALVKDGANAS